MNGTVPEQGSKEQLAAENERLRRLNDELQQKISESQCEGERLRKENERLRKEIADLRQAVEEAVRAGKRQAAPFRRTKQKENPKKPGRKPGHPGSCRKPPEFVDQVKHGPELCQCPDCQGPVEGKVWLENYEIDIPEPKLVRTRFVFQGGWCPNCKKRVYARHPDQTSTATGAAASHIGPRAVALLCGMKYWLGTPFRKAASFARHVFGLVVTAGAVVQSSHRLADKSGPTVGAMMLALRLERLVHSDETGWRVGLVGSWLWVLCSQGFTLYHVADNRCADVVVKLLGACFGGWFMRDGFASYDTQLKTYRMLRCLLHLKRNVKELAGKQTRGAVKSPREFIAWLDLVFTLKQQAPDLERAEYGRRAEALIEEFDRFVSRNYTNEKNGALARRLQERRDQIIPIVRDLELPATNNLAEQQTRFGVVIRKISAGNRTQRGALTFETLASIGATCVQQGASFLEVLLAIQLAQRGEAVIFWAEAPAPLLLPAPQQRPPLLLPAHVSHEPRPPRVFALPARLEPVVPRVFALPARLEPVVPQVVVLPARLEPTMDVVAEPTMPSTTPVASLVPSGVVAAPPLPLPAPAAARSRAAPLPAWARRRLAESRPCAGL